MADTGCEWLIGLYLISTGFRTSSSKNALTRFGRASQLVSISQAENVIHALKPMVTSVAFLTPNGGPSTSPTCVGVGGFFR